MTTSEKRRSERTTDQHLPNRRDVMTAIAAASGAVAFGWRGVAHAEGKPAPNDPAAHARDWEWLVGNWDVRHRRLRERLAGSNQWDDFDGKSALWLTMGGLGTIDDNLLFLPSGIYRALGIRAFDPATRLWSIWWLDGRHPTRIDPPVRGKFDAHGGVFVGEDTFDGRPVTVRFRWHEIHSARPHWDQALSTDGGATWEINWENFFTRTSATPTPLARIPAESLPQQRDWDFLIGHWQVRNRRLKQRLAGSTQWDEFESTLVNWPVLGGLGNVGDNVFELPGGTYRGVSIRAFDPTQQQWLSWWIDGRSPTITAPTRGRFENGVGTLIGDDVFNGRPIKVRSQWSRITSRSARWEQASSADGGTTWETNWISDFVRKA